MWWLYQHRTSPWTSLITLAAACTIVGVLVGVMALLADQLGRVKRVQDAVLHIERVRFYETGAGAMSARGAVPSLAERPPKEGTLT
jgi:hypothetical protein